MLKGLAQLAGLSGLGFRRMAASGGGASADFVVTTDAELVTAMAASTAGQIIECADAGTFSNRADMTGKTGITLRGETSRGPLLAAGINATSTTNCVIHGLRVVRTAPNSTAVYTNDHVIETGSSSGLEVYDCEISSNPLSGITMQAGSSGSLYFQGYCGIGDAAGTTGSFNIHGNSIHDCFRGVNLFCTTATTGYIERNTIIDCYQNPCETTGGAGATIYIRHNDCLGIWANAAADSGSPHSSTMGFSATAPWTPIVIGNILIAGPDRRFAAHGTYGGSSGPKFNDTTSPTDGMHYTDVICAWNICAVEDSLGLEISLGNFAVFNNTIVKEPFVSTVYPTFSFHDIGPGSYACKNVVLTQSTGILSGVSGGPNGIHSDWTTLSFDNIVLRPNGLGTTATGDWNCYDTQFVGPSFTGLSIENIVDMFTPLAGSMLEGRGAGAVGTGYDWVNRSYSSLPTFVKPRTTNPVGTTPALVQFDGTNDWMQMTATAPFLDWADFTKVTWAFYATYDGADTADCVLAESSSTDWTIRKLPTVNVRTFRFRFKNASNAAILEIDSSFQQLAADGADPATRLWLFTVDLSDGSFYIMRGKEIDPFPKVLTFRQGSIAGSRVGHAIMGSNDTTPPTGTSLYNGRLGLFYMTDQFIDLSIQSNHNTIVATDGTPADWGATGNNLTGTQPRGFVKGDAAALSAGGGINLGSSPDKWILTGSITDA